MRLFENQVVHYNLVCAFLIGISNLVQGDASQGEQANNNNNQVGLSSDILSDKLDAILDSLEILATKYDELSKRMQNCCICRKSSCQNVPQNIDNNKFPELDNGSPSAGNNGSQATPLESGIVEQSPQKRASLDGQIDGGKNLFHINKLASNSIPMSSSPWTAHDEGNLNDWLAEQENHTQMSSQVSNQIVGISERYERVFGAALENLSALMREQLIGFRITLGKLMNRVVDNSYQYSDISNQLAIIKDECSLAAANTVPSSNELKTTTTATSDQASHLGENKENFGNMQNNANAMRTSDMAIMVRLISGELEHLLVEKSKMHSEQTSAASNEAQVTLKKLNEIDSIVKQSALLLSKLTSGSHPANQVVITYNNTEPSSPASSPVSASTERAPLISRRWFAGSKIPGKSADDQAIRTPNANTSTRLASGNPNQSCQSKTSLVRPASCQQLRLAGANCSGQYYVFVRGSIRHVYCDMNMLSDDEGGGWTVILRRIDKSLGPSSSSNETTGAHKQARPANLLMEAFKLSQTNFELDWANYKSGFGQLSEWAEFFIGLDLLHLLTANQSHEIQLDVETKEANRLHLRLDHFAVGDEASQFEVDIAKDCNASSRAPCEPLIGMNQAKFYAPDRAIDRTNGPTTTTTTTEATDTSCSLDNLRWWTKIADQNKEADKSGFSCNDKLSGFAFTGPIGRQADGRVAHLYWPNWPHSAEPIRQLVLKIRRKRLNEPPELNQESKRNLN